jgi:hypothetical protein
LGAGISRSASAVGADPHTRGLDQRLSPATQAETLARDSAVLLSDCAAAQRSYRGHAKAITRDAAAAFGSWTFGRFMEIISGGRSVTETKLAVLAFLSFPGPGAFVLNISTTDGVYQRIKVSKAQLGNIVADAAGPLLRKTLAELAPTRLHGAFIKEDGDAA